MSAELAALQALMRVAEAYRAEHDALNDPCECKICLSAALCGVPTRGRKLAIDYEVARFLTRKLAADTEFSESGGELKILYAIAYAVEGEEDGAVHLDYKMAAGPVDDITKMITYVPDPDQEGTPTILKLSGDPFKDKNVVYTPLHSWRDGKWERFPKSG